MNEHRFRTLDLIIKALTLLVVLIGIPVGIWQYRDTKEKEFYAELWSRRLAIYEEASQAASEIATASSIEDCASSRARFWQLFFGRMSLIEDEPVKIAMESFAGELSDAEAGGMSIEELRQPAYRLTIALRDSLRSTWNEPFRFSESDERN